jgi:HSP20 family molecular chaperone IbpA
MAVMRTVGGTHLLPPHAGVHEDETEYVVELDVSDFGPGELGAELVGPRLTVRGEQGKADTDEVAAFRLRERLEESFRLPDDVDLEGVRAEYRHGSLHIHAPKAPLPARVVPIETLPALNGNRDAVPC